MRSLIVEDEAVSREVLRAYLAPYGEHDTALNGAEAVRKFRQALTENNPYDLICMDIMMPVMDGQQAIKEIRKIEKEEGMRGFNKVKIIMTTALEDSKNVLEAFYSGGAESYLVKPIEKKKLINELGMLNMV